MLVRREKRRGGYPSLARVFTKRLRLFNSELIIQEEGEFADLRSTLVIQQIHTRGQLLKRPFPAGEHFLIYRLHRGNIKGNEKENQKRPNFAPSKDSAVVSMD